MKNLKLFHAFEGTKVMKKNGTLEKVSNDRYIKGITQTITATTSVEKMETKKELCEVVEDRCEKIKQQQEKSRETKNKKRKGQFTKKDNNKKHLKKN